MLQVRQSGVYLKLWRAEKGSGLFLYILCKTALECPVEHLVRQLHGKAFVDILCNPRLYWKHFPFADALLGNSYRLLKQIASALSDRMHFPVDAMY